MYRWKKVWLQCHFIANNLCVSTFWDGVARVGRLGLDGLGDDAGDRGERDGGGGRSG